MPSTDMTWLLAEFENLFSQIQETVKGADKNRFLKKIEKGNISEALYFACQLSKGKDVFYHAMERLLLHKDKLNLNINYSTSKGNPIYFALDNENLWLYDLLMRHGADVNFSGPKGQVSLLHAIYLYKRLNFEVIPKIDGAFLDETHRLGGLFEKISELPMKGSLDTSETVKQSDELRLEFINQALRYLDVYYNKGKLSPHPKFTANQQKIYSEYMLSCERNCLEKICHAIHHLSGPLRKKYDTFALAGFSWINFEQLGSYLLREKAFPRFYLPFGLLSENLSAVPDYIERFHYELSDTEVIIEEGIPDIIKSDVMALIGFFEEITEAEKSGANVEVKPVALPAIKAITSRITSNLSFLKLANLFHFTEHKSLQNIAFPESNFCILLSPQTDNNNNIVEKPSLESMKSRHALLKRFLKIGELFVGRNFSSELFDFDKTVAWRALVEIRDGICHQDERTNDLIVKTLLNDQKRLEKILEELTDLGRRIFTLLEKREMTFGQYIDPLQHWKNIFKQQGPQHGADVNAVPAAPTIRRIDKTDEDTFLTILKTNNVPEEIQKQFQAIFDGTRIDYPSKVELGQLGGKAYATLGKDDKTKCRDILAKLKQPTTTATERNQKRDEEKRAKEEREKNKNSLLKGLEEIRKLAEEFSLASTKKSVPNPMKNLMAAKQALEYIKEYLNQYHYLIENKQSFAELEEHHAQNSRPTLKTILSKDNELNDALEYNLGQLLQQLEQLFNNNKLDNLDLNKQRMHLRKIRNYIEHGDPILDTQGKNYQAASEEIKQELYTAMIALIYDNGLNLIEAQLTNKSPGSLSLHAPVKATENTQAPTTYVKSDKMEMGG